MPLGAFGNRGIHPVGDVRHFEQHLSLRDKRARVRQIERRAECVERDHRVLVLSCDHNGDTKKMPVSCSERLEKRIRVEAGPRPAGEIVLRGMRASFLAGRMAALARSPGPSRRRRSHRCLLPSAKSPTPGDAAAVGAVDHAPTCRRDGRDRVGGAPVDIDGDLEFAGVLTVTANAGPVRTVTLPASAGRGRALHPRGGGGVGTGPLWDPLSWLWVLSHRALTLRMRSRDSRPPCLAGASHAVWVACG